MAQAQWHATDHYFFDNVVGYCYDTIQHNTVSIHEMVQCPEKMQNTRANVCLLKQFRHVGVKLV